ncbi:5-dehydro-2-deoxygluconokinase [Haloactinopolyspora alba]|uniref:5-dehydro-2-deoxygluconokinase n=1 Tax=Haloactinopolyspora alba TaxID=648780 RepID=A0A2P8DZT7_9ACTN|nr:5-dehydro-2-deoxygluconokinase [Haloactinopolyspora alba]PSL02734.1 5-dehydro-2-deoxygluconokinase [Haloactinopolyspora alba]
MDVLTIGRVGVDIYPNQIGVGLEDVTSFTKYLGGSATNVAVAAARHGREAAVVTRTGEDPLGRFVHRALRGYGVDDRYVTAVPSLATPVTLCEIFPPDDFPIYFYGRIPTAPDLQISTDELDLDAVREADIFWATGTGLCQDPSRSATLAALEARGRTGHTVLDLDYRPMFWESREHARTHMQEALRHVTVAVGNLDECETAVGTRDPEEAAAALRELGVTTAVVKRGPKGVLAVDDTGSYDVPPILVDVVNGLGAGDAFGGALCHTMLAGMPLDECVRFANAAGAIVTTELACSDAMPTTEAVTAFLEEDARVR